MISACDSRTHDDTKLKVGDRFPLLAFPDQNGKVISLADYHGKVVILNVWATWCGPCRAEMPSLQRLADRLNPEKFVVIGISTDYDDHLVREFLLEQEVRFVNAIDKGAEVLNDRLDLLGLPTTVLIASNGTIRELIEGAREWDSPEMMDLIDELLSDTSH